MTAAELIEAAALPEEAAALATPEMRGGEFIDALAQSGRQAEVVRALAHALTPRETVRWAAECLRRGAPASAGEAAALEAVERWLADPSDENRRAALVAAERAPGTPAGVLASAVFLTEGSVAPPQAPVVPPVPYAAAKAASGAIILAVVSREPAKAHEKFAALIEDGMQRARELKIW
jgi:hypothetical protein